MNKELKPCPFCGSKARLLGLANKCYEVECENVECHVDPATWIDGEPDEVIKAWNTRTPDASMLEHAVRRAVELRDRPVPYMNVDEILAQVLREVKG